MISWKKSNIRLSWRHYCVCYTFLVSFSYVITRVESVCPKLCQCKWRDGKETVACSNADFIDIPRGLDSTTQVLDLRRNNLKILPNDAFLDTGLVNLQKIWLNYCKLKYIINGAFRHLANLIELDLSDNFLTNIPSDALSDLSGLRIIGLSRNLISEIPKEAFKSIPLLVKLDISHNIISTVHEKAFSFLNRLEDLKLSFNRLKTLPVNVLQPLALLNGLHVDNNPWHCNCHLRLLRQWLLQRNVAASIPPNCEIPERLNGRAWQTLSEDEFVCIPLVTAVTQRVIASHGDNVTLACKVETDVDAAVTWIVGDVTLANTSTETQKKYSVLELETANSGARVSNLTIESAAVQDQGTYRCVAENKAGRVETNLTLKVAEEITEVRFIAKPERVYVEWTYGIIAGVIAIAVLMGIVITLRLRRSGQQKSPHEMIDSDENIIVNESTPESFDQKSNFIDYAKPNSKCHSSTKSVDHMPSVSSTNNANACTKNSLVHVNELNQKQSISYVQMPNIYLANNQCIVDMIHPESIIRTQLKQVTVQDFSREPNSIVPDLLNLSTSSRGPASQHNFTKDSTQENYSNISYSVGSLLSEYQNQKQETDPLRYQSGHPRTSLLNKEEQSQSSIPGCSNYRRVRFQDEKEPTAIAEDAHKIDSIASKNSTHLLQYHATQLYKFLQEYKLLQDQLHSFRSENGNLITTCVASVHAQSTNNLASIPDIQSSIDYLLAHQSSATTLAAESNFYTPSDEYAGVVDPNVLMLVPPPPNYLSDSKSNEIDHIVEIIPPPLSHATSIPSATCTNNYFHTENPVPNKAPCTAQSSASSIPLQETSMLLQPNPPHTK